MKKTTLVLITLFCISISFAQTTATYEVEFTNFWNSTDHSQGGTSFPGSNAHWSNIVGVNHNNTVTFFEMGGSATAGVEKIAETGVIDGINGFESEVQTAIDANNAEQFFELGDLFLNVAPPVSRSKADLEIKEEYPLVSLLSMIAPSPDWFAGVNSINLRDGSGWRNSVSIDLLPYDAGTEDGTTYSLSNTATNPQGTIQSIQNINPFNNEKVATLTFTLQSVLNVNEEILKQVHIFPNPVNDFISINVPNIIQLKTVEIYSILGKRIKVLESKNSDNNLQFDVSNLNSGIYLLRLNTSDNESITQKIIIK